MWSPGFRIYSSRSPKSVVESDKTFKKWLNNVNFAISDFNGCLNHYKITHGYNRKCVVKVFFLWFACPSLIANCNVNINIGLSQKSQFDIWKSQSFDLQNVCTIHILNYCQVTENALHIISMSIRCILVLLFKFLRSWAGQIKTIISVLWRFMRYLKAEILVKT